MSHSQPRLHWQSLTAVAKLGPCPQSLKHQMLGSSLELFQHPLACCPPGVAIPTCRNVGCKYHSLLDTLSKSVQLVAHQACVSNPKQVHFRDAVCDAAGGYSLLSRAVPSSVAWIASRCVGLALAGLCALYTSICWWHMWHLVNHQHWRCSEPLHLIYHIFQKKVKTKTIFSTILASEIQNNFRVPSGVLEAQPF